MSSSSAASSSAASSSSSAERSRIYDCSVEVKYFAIQCELLQTVLRSGAPPPGEAIPSCGYTTESVCAASHVLYQAEMRKAFRQLDTDVEFSIPAEDIHALYAIMSTNPMFVQMIDDICPVLSVKNEGDIGERLFVLCWCFDLFHLMHPIICQQLTTGAIDIDSVERLHKRACDVLKNVVGRKAPTLPANADASTSSSSDATTPAADATTSATDADATTPAAADADATSSAADATSSAADATSSAADAISSMIDL